MFLSKRNGIYYLWYRDQNGKKKKVTTGTTIKAEALQFVRNFKETDKSHTTSPVLLSSFISQLFDHIRANMSIGTLRIYESAFQHFLDIHNDQIISNLTAYHFDRYKIFRLKKVSPVTVNIELRAIKAGLSVAKRWKIINANPFEGLSLVPVPEHEPVFYKMTEFKSLVSTIKEEWLRNVVIFSAITGMRQGEILSLRWGQVDLVRGMLKIESDINFRTKTGKRRTIPLSSAADILLKSIKISHSSDCVFTLNGMPLQRRWVGEKLRRYIRYLGLNRKLNFHSLRHSFASWLAMDGVSIYQISVLLGHSNVSVTQEFYAHLQPDSLRDVVNRITVNLN